MLAKSSEHPLRHSKILSWTATQKGLVPHLVHLLPLNLGVFQDLPKTKRTDDPLSGEKEASMMYFEVLILIDCSKNTSLKESIIMEFKVLVPQ